MLRGNFGPVSNMFTLMTNTFKTSSNLDQHYSAGPKEHQRTVQSEAKYAPNILVLRFHVSIFFKNNLLTWRLYLETTWRTFTLHLLYIF